MFFHLNRFKEKQSAGNSDQISQSSPLSLSQAPKIFEVKLSESSTIQVSSAYPEADIVVKSQLSNSKQNCIGYSERFEGAISCENKLDKESTKYEGKKVTGEVTQPVRSDASSSKSKMNLSKKDEDIDHEAFSQTPQGIAILSQYRNSRQEFGMARIRMGSYLTLIRDNKLWKGLADNWESFLAAENLNVHAARQYMSVARKYIFEMDLPEETLHKLSMAGITALEKAGKVITDENQEDVIDVLTNLSEKDAIQRIVEMSGADEGFSDKPTLRVLRLMREFYEMPPDLQLEFLGKISVNRKKVEKSREKD